MGLVKKRNLTISMRRGAMILLGLGAFAVTGTGCGDPDAQDSTDRTQTQPPGNITRSATGAVEMIDSLNDIKTDDPNLQSAPSFLDINRASISKEANSLRFAMELASALPDGPERGAVVEWGFLLDLDGDGNPDRGIFADLTTKDGWVYGMFDQKTRERVTGARFPGTFTHSGTSLVFTVDSAALGDPTGFTWFAYSDAALAVSGGNTQKVGDKIWEPAVPDNSKDWLPFP